MQITITNETEDCTVKLLSRHWIIKNSEGHTEEVRWVCPWPAVFTQAAPPPVDSCHLLCSVQKVAPLS